VKLSVKAIEAIKATDKRTEYPDHIVQGLRLIVQPSGIKSFQLRYRHAGKGKRMSLGRLDRGATLATVRDQARTALLNLETGTDPSHQATQAKAATISHAADVTIAALLDRYEREKLSGLKSKKNALTFLREFREEYGNLEIGNFTKQHFTNLTARFAAEGKGTKANRVHAHIKTFYNWCIGLGIADSSPCDRVPKPFKEQSKERFLQAHEIKLFWQATASDLEPWGHLYRFLLLTGQRLNEAALMTDHELMAADHWHLKSARTKNGLRHDVFLPHQAAEIILRETRIAGTAGFVFTTTGEGPVRSFDKPNKRLRARMNELAGSKIDHFTPHDLRRTCETGLAMLGTPQPVIDRITNHITGRGMARVYNLHDYRPEKAAALQKWANHIGDVVNE
jgi:integrase